MIPSQAETYRLIRARRMPEHILRHSLMVRRVALVIGTWLNTSDFYVNLALVERASLLHDICKADCIGNGHDHALLGKELLCREGFATVGDIVGQHVRLNTWEVGEAMVVNYADKRVMHDRVVSLNRRFLDLMDRYGTDEIRQERILLHHQKCLQIQDILLKSCKVDLESLVNLNLIPCDETLYGR
ncbi:MAG TPA: HDIG domain-containing protein [Desulfomonilia bacterium]|nr:HDIG domain-containing protein [Desulfomonilia bacterium]